MEGEVMMLMLMVGVSIGRKKAKQEEASGTIRSCKKVRSGSRG